MHRIKNFDALATTSQRADALEIAEAAYEGIDARRSVRAKLSFEGATLSVDDRSYDLSQFKRIRVMGFGKVSCAAAAAIESLLRGHVKDGAVIDVRPGTCGVVDVVQGSHPRPTPENVAFSEKLVAMANESKEDDLVIVVVSGGGSSLLCWPAEECDQAARLYDDLTRTGASIAEMNTVRKHLSGVKGGGLAALLYPATVIGLVFCDIPGERFEDVASGPTYFDKSTVEDARRVLDRYGLTGYSLNETPKDPRLFERVQNVPVVSNTDAVRAMEEKARELGYRAVVLGADRYDEPSELVERMFGVLGRKTAVIAGGEPRIAVANTGAKGGRCEHTALTALPRVADGEVFLAFASDGIDNTDAAGAVADAAARSRAGSKGLSIRDRLAEYNSYDFLKACDALLYTGATDANVSDLFILLRT